MKNKDNTYVQNYPYWTQQLASLTVVVLIVSAGSGFGWPAPSVPQLSKNMSSDEVSYIVVVSSIASIFGSPAGAYLADYVGRKITLLSIAIPFLLSWIIIALANTTWVFIFARCIFGFGDGMLDSCAPMYFGEISNPEVRGIISAYSSLGFVGGMLIVNGVGSFVSITTAAIIFSTLPVIFIILFVWMPESPYFFLMKGNPVEAKKSLKFLRSGNIDTEFVILRGNVRKQMSEFTSFKDLIYSQNHRKSLIIIVLLRTFQQFSGTFAFSFYIQVIFQQAGGGISTYLSSTIYLAVQLLSVLMSMSIVDKFGRRPLLLFSAFLSGVVLFMIATYFYIKECTVFDTSHFSFVPVVGLMAYTVVQTVGFGVVPSVMSSEIFSSSIKAKAMSITIVIYSLETVVVSKTYQFISENIGIYMSFYFFGACCFVAFLTFKILIPETKGLTLEEIQQKLNRKPSIKIIAV